MRIKAHIIGLSAIDCEDAMPSINRLDPYTALADVYQAAGFAAYSLGVGPRLLEMAFEMDWTGRSLLDLACGTGDLACWFTEHGFRVIGIDASPAMLRHGSAHASQTGLAVEFLTADMRTFKPNNPVEMVTCLGGSLNAVPTLRDLENVFRQAALATLPGKLFIFDLRTIQGLATAGQTDRIVFDNGEDILIVTRSLFNYETLLLAVQYIIQRYTESAGWQRADETHALRGYPIQAVATLLGKTGFKLLRILTPDMQPAEDRQDAEMLLFIARREA
jgi:SAM-dependent methyltransferase